MEYKYFIKAEAIYNSNTHLIEHNQWWCGGYRTFRNYIAAHQTIPNDFGNCWSDIYGALIDSPESLEIIYDKWFHSNKITKTKYKVAFEKSSFPSLTLGRIDTHKNIVRTTKLDKADYIVTDFNQQRTLYVFAFGTTTVNNVEYPYYIYFNQDDTIDFIKQGLKELKSYFPDLSIGVKFGINGYDKTNDSDFLDKMLSKTIVSTDEFIKDLGRYLSMPSDEELNSITSMISSGDKESKKAAYDLLQYYQLSDDQKLLVVKSLCELMSKSVLDRYESGLGVSAKYLEYTLNTKFGKIYDTFLGWGSFLNKLRFVKEKYPNVSTDLLRLVFKEELREKIENDYTCKNLLRELPVRIILRNSEESFDPYVPKDETMKQILNRTIELMNSYYSDELNRLSLVIDFEDYSETNRIDL